jgi:hypothetical protein
MDKKIAGLLGAAAALATVGAANATEVQGNAPNPASNYRELLAPVPNALAALKADDARRDGESRDGVKLAQVTIGVGHHHHHHHHHGPRIIVGHHHHHVRHHHHHHHHHD